MGFTIGQLSRLTQVKVPTIRYYEIIGLLPNVPRSEGGRRSFDVSTVDRIKLIRHARDLGFEMESIRNLLRISELPESSCQIAHGIAREHLIEVDRRIAQLNVLKQELERIVTECNVGPAVACGVLSALADHSQCRSTDHVSSKHNKGTLNHQ